MIFRSPNDPDLSDLQTFQTGFLLSNAARIRFKNYNELIGFTVEE